MPEIITDENLETRQPVAKVPIRHSELDPESSKFSDFCTSAFAGVTVQPSFAGSSRDSSMTQAILYLLVYILLAILPVALAVVRAPTMGGAFLYEFGRNLGLASFVILALQPVLTARFSWIDRSVGTLNLLRFHKAMGLLALVSAFLHPISLAIGGAGPGLLTSWDVPWFVAIGKVVLSILTIHVVLAVLRSTLRLNFQTWKTIHTIGPPIIILGAFVHSWSAGADLHIPEIQVCWIALLALAFAAILHKRMTALRVKWGYPQC